MKIETRSGAIAIRTADGDGSTFEGIGCRFLTIDTYGTIFVPGCFAQDLDTAVRSGVIRDEHCETVGKLTAATETTEGLTIAGTILPTTRGNDVKILLKGDALQGLSVGFIRKTGYWLETIDDVKTLWAQHNYTPTDEDLKRAEYGAYAFTRVALKEVSTTWNPSVTGSQITSVRTGQRGRLSLGEECRQMLDSLATLQERVARVKGLRAAEGRDISQETRSLMDRIEHRFAELKRETTEAKKQPETPENRASEQANVRTALAKLATIEASLLID